MRQVPLVLISFVLVLLGARPASADTGPALETPASKLAAAVRCPASFTDTEHEPVLLVHGTFADAQANWGWNYLPQLTSLGFDVCMVDFPNHSLDDIQVAAEYAVHAIRFIAEKSGEKVDVITSSQGSLQGRWAIKWWPDVEDAVDDLVLLAGVNHGTDAGRLAATFGRCFESCWQMATGSNFINALNAGDETPGDISYTSLYTLFDEMVFPQFPTSTSALDGATNIALQDVCPGRPSDHVAISTSDAVAYALALDALTHNGPASVDRFDVATCAQATMPGTDLSALEGGGGAGFGGFDDYVTAEPPLKAYATTGGPSADAADDAAPESPEEGDPAPQADPSTVAEREVAVGGAATNASELPAAGLPLGRMVAIGLTLIALGTALLKSRGCISKRQFDIY